MDFSMTAATDASSSFEAPRNTKKGHDFFTNNAGIDVRLTLKADAFLLRKDERCASGRT